MLLCGDGYRDSLRRYQPRVFVNGARIPSVADSPALAPGLNAIAVTYDFAHDERHRRLLTVEDASGRMINRMTSLDRTSDDLLTKLEAVRVLCRETGCAQRYLTKDAANGIWQATFQADATHGTEYHLRFAAYLDRVQQEDLTLGIAMTDAKGDRSQRPGAQANPDVYVHITERRKDGIVIRGTKAIVTAAPYVHEFLVMPCRTITPEDAVFAVCCAVPADAAGVTIVARPAGRPGEPGAIFSGRYGQSTGAVIFDDVFVPWERVFMAGEVDEASLLTTSYATHHRQSCIAARAGFGDLLIGASAMMIDANGLDPERHGHIRDAMVELISTVEGFYACGVAASVTSAIDASGVAMPDAVFSNVGKLLLATKIYDMHRLAHEVSGGLIVALPGPEEDHNPETAASLAAVLGGRAGVTAAHRLDVARLVEDLTASSAASWYSVISLHGGGSPEAMKREIWRQYPVGERREIAQQILERGIDGRAPGITHQPGQCCSSGC
ncbi:MAG: 4-hydroxyphenylacetate 3-hydroxylase family protein [Dehalococcoidia bacterium]